MQKKPYVENITVCFTHPFEHSDHFKSNHIFLDDDFHRYAQVMPNFIERAKISFIDLNFYIIRSMFFVRIRKKKKQAVSFVLSFFEDSIAV